jgi:hypothetical protein
MVDILEGNVRVYEYFYWLTIRVLYGLRFLYCMACDVSWYTHVGILGLDCGMIECWKAHVSMDCSFDRHVRK